MAQIQILLCVQCDLDVYNMTQSQGHAIHVMIGWIINQIQQHSEKLDILDLCGLLSWPWRYDLIVSLARWQ